MTCPKCGAANSDATQFCTRCHAVLLYKCPVCWHQQRQGGRCEKCGCIFDRYWMTYLVRQAKEERDVEADRMASRLSRLAALVFFPLPGVRALFRFLLGRLFGD